MSSGSFKREFNPTDIDHRLLRLNNGVAGERPEDQCRWEIVSVCREIPPAAKLANEIFVMGPERHVLVGS